MIPTEFLSPPGTGLFTINRERPLQEKYMLAKFNGKESQWKKSLNHLDHPLSIIGIPSDTGAGVLKGSNWGPTFLRSVMESYTFNDLGDIKCIPHLLSDELLNEKTLSKVRMSLYGNENSQPVSPLNICEEFSLKYFNAHPEKKLLALGGDNSISYPLIKSWLKTREHNKVAVVHIDAHTDFSQDRLGIDVTFGSWAYHACHQLEEPRRFVQIGTRNSSHPQEYWEKNHHIKQYWADDLRNQLFERIEEIVTYLQGLSTEEIYISLDLDVLDPEYFDLTGTPEKEGLLPHHLICILKRLGKEFQVTAMDINEYAPHLFSQNQHSSQTTLNMLINCIMQEVL